MTYQLTLHTPNLLIVEIWGNIDQVQAETFVSEAHSLLDKQTSRLHLLVDGRALRGTTAMARKHMEQIARHPRLGAIAVVVNWMQWLVLHPFTKLQRGINLFSSTDEAIAFLQEDGAVLELAADELFHAPVAVLSQDLVVASDAAVEADPLFRIRYVGDTAGADRVAYEEPAIPAQALAQPQPFMKCCVTYMHGLANRLDALVK